MTYNIINIRTAVCQATEAEQNIQHKSVIEIYYIISGEVVIPFTYIL